MLRGFATLAAAAAAVATLDAAVQAPREVPAIESVLQRAGARLESYYARARSIICTETVRMQPLGADLMPEGFGREVVYDLRVEWDAVTEPGKSPEARVVRELKLVNGRTPRPSDEERKQLACLQPQSISSEPLAFLLEPNQRDHVFTFAGFGKALNRRAVLLDYRPRQVGEPALAFNGDCISLELPGRMQGRVWIDPEDDAVLRYDERLTSQVTVRVPREHEKVGNPPYMTLERADLSTRFRSVTFREPDETVMLPETEVRMVWWHGTGTPRYRRTSTYSNYRRFMTDVRVIQ